MHIISRAEFVEKCYEANGHMNAQHAQLMLDAVFLKVSAITMCWLSYGCIQGEVQGDIFLAEAACIQSTPGSSGLCQKPSFLLLQHLEHGRCMLLVRHVLVRMPFETQLREVFLSLSR